MVVRSASTIGNAGRLVNKKTYVQEYHKLTEKTGIPFVPDAVWKDAVFTAVIMLAVMAARSGLALWPTGQPDPPSLRPRPSPTSHFYGSTQSSPICRQASNTVLFIAPVLIIAPCCCSHSYQAKAKSIVAPSSRCLDGCCYRRHSRRVHRLGMYTPWSPIMDAWTSNPIPEADLKDRTPLERQGALVLQNKQCRNCHAIAELEACASRIGLNSIAHDRRSDHPPGSARSGNMPAYGNALNPSETTALVHFCSRSAAAIYPPLSMLAKIGSNQRAASGSAQASTIRRKLALQLEPSNAS